MTYIQKVNLNGRKLYRVSEPSRYGWRISYCTFEEVLYILSTKEQK